MTDTQAYLIADAERQQTYKRFLDSDSPAEVAADLAAARLIASEALNRGQHGTALAALGIVGKLSDAYTRWQVRNASLLEKAVVMRLGTQLIGLIAEELQGTPNWEDIVERVADRMTATIEGATNEPKLLKGPE